MKTNIFLATALLVSFSAAAAPVKYSKCGINVNMPADAGQYYFDENCKTIYVAPSRGRIEFELMSKRPDVKLICDQIAANDRELLKIASANAKDSKRLLKAVRAGKDVSDLISKMDKSRDERKIIETALTEETVRIGAREAAIYEARFYSGWDQAIHDYQEANPTLKVEALPYDTAVLHFNEKSEQEFRADSREATISFQFQQMELVPSLNGVKFNEGTRTKLRLSYFGVCGRTEDKWLNAFAVGTMTYLYKLSEEPHYGTVAIGNF